MSYLRHRFWTPTMRRHAEAYLRDRARKDAKSRQEKDRRDETAERAEDAGLAFAAATTLPVPAPPERIEAFERDLTEFEVAIVKALLGNQRALDEVTLRIELMLSQAYFLPDGRRVFRSEDGLQVFDEFGEEVSAEELDPTAIPDHAPTWEQFSADTAARDALEAKRAELLEFQGKVDAARSEILNDNISISDLDALEADLMDAMPPSLAPYLPQDSTLTTVSPEAESTKPYLTDTDKPLNAAIERLDM